MTAFRVWLRPLGNVCRIRVDGAENAQWLIERLRHTPEVKVGDRIAETQGPSICSFRVQCKPPSSRASLQALLKAIPELQVMTEPE